MESTELQIGDPEAGIRRESMGEKVRKVIEKIGENSGKIVSMFVAGLTVLQPYHAAVAGSRFAIRRFRVPEYLSSIYVSKYHTALHTLSMFGVIAVNVYMWFYGSAHLRFNPLLSVFTNFLVTAVHIGMLISYMVKSERDLTMYYWFSAAGAFICGANQAFVASVGVEYLSFFVCGLQFAGIGVTLFHSLFLSIAKLVPSLDTDYWIISVQLMLCTAAALTSLLLWNNFFGQGDLGRMFKGEKIEGDEKDQIKVINPLEGNGLYISDGQDLSRRRRTNGGSRVRVRSLSRNPGTSRSRDRSSSRNRDDSSSPRYDRSTTVTETLASARLQSPGNRRFSPRYYRDTSLASTNQRSESNELNDGRYRESRSLHYEPMAEAIIGDYSDDGSGSNADGVYGNYGNGGSLSNSEHSSSGKGVRLDEQYSGETAELPEGVRADRHTVQLPRRTIFQSLKLAKSPILMSAFSMSLAFFFYPSVAPYRLADLVEAHKIDLSVLVVAAVPTIAVCILCLIEMGPNKMWVRNNKYWNYYWYLAFPYLFSCISFVVAMHYPNTGYAKFVKNPVVLAFMVDLMIACYSLLKTVGYAGAGMQEEPRNPTVSTFNMMFSFLFLFAGVFWGSGYIKIYNRYTREEWPTRGMWALKAFLYWLKHSFNAGFTNFTKIITSDLMRDIMSTSPLE
ncbi:hypothetical protein MACK_001133 [Theileria orientalis]|uniref:Uncharacterized protein n=1 Tax=Theileria orientalis TaxID=68886 RepID=A0A976MC01_THEOR|nr:hypothetical protein MACK_001133 [Theileria orientalis]